MKLEIPPKGAFCAHTRMRLVWCSPRCAFKLKTGGKGCTLRCPDCGFEWMLGEGVLG